MLGYGTAVCTSTAMKHGRTLPESVNLDEALSRVTYWAAVSFSW